MSIDVFEPSVPSLPAAEEVYAQNRDLLIGISVRKFRVPLQAAEELVNDVFVTYLASAHSVRNVRSYLVGAICNASRYYHRSVDRSEPMPDEAKEWSDPLSFAIADDLATQMTVRETVKRLHEKCRKTLHLKYWNGNSASEMARELATTDRYAEKLIHKCLGRARKIYRMLTMQQGDVS